MTAFRATGQHFRSCGPGRQGGFCPTDRETATGGFGAPEKTRWPGPVGRFRVPWTAGLQNSGFQILISRASGLDAGGQHGFRYRGQDVAGHFFIEQSSPVSITEAAYNQNFMRRSHLHKGDVLLSIVGTIGESSVVSSDRKATCSCKLAILRPRDVGSNYLAAFLRSKYGRSQIQRLTRGAVQMGLLLEDLDQVFVPNLSRELQGKISEITLASWNQLLNGERFTLNAEEQLLESLNLQFWQAPEPLSYVRYSKEAFAAGRFDAEYFYPAKIAALEVLNYFVITNQCSKNNHLQ